MTFNCLNCVALAVCFLVAACGRPAGVAIGPEPPEATTVEKVFVATSRTPVEAPVVYGSGRDETLNFGMFDVSVPPDREGGKIKAARPGQTPDATREYYVAEENQYSDKTNFRAAVEKAIQQNNSDERAVSVFVHGFNNTFVEGLYRNAQMSADFGSKAVTVHYSWPSAGRARLYLYDRDSAFFARDGLEELLNTLATTSARRIILIAHSMGAQVAVETVRQMAIRGDPAVASKLYAVILLSPDVDLDLFNREVAALRRRDLPWYIFVSSKDRALEISAVLRGDASRLGQVENPNDIKVTNATLIDLSAVRNDDPLSHQTVAESPAMIAVLKGYNDKGRDYARQVMQQHGLVVSTGEAAGDVEDVVLAPLGQ